MYSKEVVGVAQLCGLVWKRIHGIGRVYTWNGGQDGTCDGGLVGGGEQVYSREVAGGVYSREVVGGVSLREAAGGIYVRKAAGGMYLREIVGNIYSGEAVGGVQLCGLAGMQTTGIGCGHT